MKSDRSNILIIFLGISALIWFVVALSHQIDLFEKEQIEQQIKCDEFSKISKDAIDICKSIGGIPKVVMEPPTKNCTVDVKYIGCDK